MMMNKRDLRIQRRVQVMKRQSKLEVNMNQVTMKRLNLMIKTIQNLDHKLQVNMILSKV